MARFIRSQIRIPYDSGAAADVSVMTFHFYTSAVGSLAQEVADIDTKLSTFLTTIDQELSENVNPTATLKHYDMEDTPERVPVLETTEALTVGADSLPNQVSMVVRLEASVSSGSERRRRRGRHFVGPLRAAAIADSTGDTSPAAGSRDQIGNAYGDLIPSWVGPTSASTIIPCVFSVSDALGLAVGSTQPPDDGFSAAELTLGFHPIIRAVIPNRFGMQRRRRAAVSSTNIYT